MATIDIPRCAKCGRFEPTLTYVHDDDTEEPMCALCMEELFPVKWTIYLRDDGHYGITDGDVEPEHGTAVRSGLFTDCWAWVMTNDPG